VNRPRHRPPLFPTRYGHQFHHRHHPPSKSARCFLLPSGRDDDPNGAADDPPTLPDVPHHDHRPPDPPARYRPPGVHAGLWGWDQSRERVLGPPRRSLVERGGGAAVRGSDPPDWAVCGGGEGEKVSGRGDGGGADGRVTEEEAAGGGKSFGGWGGWGWGGAWESYAGGF